MGGSVQAPFVARAVLLEAGAAPSVPGRMGSAGAATLAILGAALLAGIR
jgi:hypothetical protein